MKHGVVWRGTFSDKLQTTCYNHHMTISPSLLLKDWLITIRIALQHMPTTHS